MPVNLFGGKPAPEYFNEGVKQPLPNNFPYDDNTAGEDISLEEILGVGSREDNRLVGIGGAPTRVTTLPKDSAGRKTYPIASGFLDYFPDAIAAISHMSYVATQQHHPDKPMHWDREKSKDEADTMMRHFMQRGTRDEDGERHSTKMAWRALALLQKEIEGGK